MKNGSWIQKPVHLICGLLFAGAVCLGISLQSDASQNGLDAARVQEHKTVTLEAEGILQNGDLLQEPAGNFSGRRNDSISAYGARAADFAAAEQKLEEGLDAFQTQISIEGCGITQQEFSQFYQNFVNNHPKYFYLKGGCSYSMSGGYVTTVIVAYSSSDTEARAQAAEYEAKVAEILRGVHTSWSDLEKALYVNDYIAVNCEYDQTLQKHNAYNALVEGTTVCQGYALAFLDLMNRLGISCEVVSSKALNHAWDLVKINDSWYHVDVTWNDPVKDRYGRARHFYFLKSSGWFRSDAGEHTAADWVFSGDAQDAQAGSTAFDTYFWNDVDSPFGYYDGFWYGTEVSGNKGMIAKYSGSGQGLEKQENIKEVSELWNVWGGTGFWQGNYSGCCVIENKLYYASPQAVNAINLATKAEEVAYALSEEEKNTGNIYGFYVTKDHVLKYELAQSPGESGVRKTAAFSGHSHSFGNWKIVQPATCTTKGIQIKSCSCGEEEEQEISLTAHTPGPAATCTTPQTCTVCKTEIQPKAAHTAGPAATCTTPQTCTVCKTEIQPKAAHTAGPAATCTTPQTCTVCKTEIQPKAAHTPGPAATCTTPQTCTVCKTEIQPKAAHTPGPAATCTTPQTCTVCKTVITNAAVHKPGPAATCTTPQTCTVCKTVLAKATGHRSTKKSVTKKATFTKTGTEKTICKDCGKTLKTKTISKIKCKKGKSYTVGSYKYKIVSPKTNGQGTVSFAGLAKNTKKVVIGDTVTILGAKFKIVQIEDRALKNKSSITSVTIGKNVKTIGKEALAGTKKLKTITIKSAKLTRVGANALKNTYAKLKIKTPKTKLNKYKALFKKKGQKSSVKISR